MTSALERDQAIAADIASELERRLGLTADGVGYVNLWVIRRLTHNRGSEWRRPQCPFNYTVGQRLRDAADELVAAEVERRRSGGFVVPSLSDPPDLNAPAGVPYPDDAGRPLRAL